MSGRDDATCVFLNESESNANEWMHESESERERRAASE